MKEIISSFRKQLSGKFHQDVLWNIASVAIMGICGILINILIVYFYNAATLGVYNQVFAAFVFFSQLAVGGLHLSSVKYVAEHSSNHEECEVIIIAALITVGVISFVISTGLWLSRNYVGDILSSPGVAKGIFWTAPGLFLAAVNKVFLGILNGFRHMKIYSFFQSLRGVLMLLFLLAAAFLSARGENLVLILTLAEVIVFLCFLVINRKYIKPVSLEKLRKWIVKHFNFGIKSFLSSNLLELNTRIDVLILGYFMADKVVGIYSFATILIEGAYQLLIVLRINFNPLLVKLITEKKISELKVMIKKGKKATYLMTTIAGITAIILFPEVIKLITNKPDLAQSWPFFSILMSGIILTSGYIPFRQILLTAGFPGLQTIITLSIIIFNILADIVFIPIWGAYGAAFASMLSLVFFVFLIRELTERKIGIII